MLSVDKSQVLRPTVTKKYLSLNIGYVTLHLDLDPFCRGDSVPPCRQSPPLEFHHDVLCWSMLISIYLHLAHKEGVFYCE